MQYASVRSVLRANPAAEPPVRVAGVPAQNRQIEALHKEIGRTLPRAEVSMWGEQKTLVVPVDLSGSDAAHGRYGGSERVRVFFSGEVLHVGPSSMRGGTPLSGASHLLRIVDAMRDRMRELGGRAQKRDKLRTLQQRSLGAQVAATAARLGIDCELRCTHAMAHLFVRFDPCDPQGPRNGLAVLVPYARAEAVLSELGPMLASARELYRRGAACKAAFSVNVEEYPDPSDKTAGSSGPRRCRWGESKPAAPAARRTH